MNPKALFERLLDWQRKHIEQKYFVLILAVLVGLTSGLAAVLLKNSVHFIHEALTIGFAQEYHNYLYFFYPLIGILISVWLVKRFFFGKWVGHGVPNVLYAISKQQSMIKRFRMFNSFFTSAITVGFGGSTGLEGPTVGTSASIASNIGRWFKVSYKTRTLLLGCAAAGALASIFNAPIAAIIFALEVIMLDLTTASLIPLLLASVSAALTSRLFLGDDVLFHFKNLDKFSISDLPFFILLGIVSGVVSVYFCKMFFRIMEFSEKKKKKLPKAIVSGLLLGALIFLFPSLYGEGYELINALVKGNFQKIVHDSLFYGFRENIPIILLILTVTMLLKVVATSLTIGSGGVGGIFAPSLFTGSIMGFSFAKLLNHYGIATLSESNFTLVGMAGLMAGILRAPLTAIFLIAEITGGYELFIPLMVTASIAFLTGKYFMPHSIYTTQLAKRGELITHDKDQAVLTLMSLKKEIETDFMAVNVEGKLGDLVRTVTESKRNIFPVTDAEGKFYGVVLLDDIRDIMFLRHKYDETTVLELLHVAPAEISPDETMDSVMKKFEETGAWNLPVVENGKYKGFVSKSKLFNAYRSMLKEFYEEN
ncbi:MAG: chloride channel protein [Flavobacteriales bacterium]|nr:chloride channel protein [Bacteroidales bacterium AH-315-I05]PCJ87498.1 MAG: chloride channel protein [Flavobacteriales bacterium]